MKKSTKVNIWLLIVCGVISWLLIVCGVLALSYGIFSPTLSETTSLTARIAGGLLIIIGAALFIMSLTEKALRNKKVAIEEYDERNISVRRRAAEKAINLSPIIWLSAIVILLALELYLPAIIVGVGLIAQGGLWIALIVYYQKRM
jgi:uncharacterized membrane protein YbhN (UPF0104 family)